MPDWKPVAVLPNVFTNDIFEGGPIALTSTHDARVREILSVDPSFGDFLTRFTDAFGVKLNPAILIVRTECLSKLAPDAIPSFRDVVAMSVIPYSRALNIIYGPRQHIYYSSSFWLYPWITRDDLGPGHMTLSTPALSAFHVVKEFSGQSSPETALLELRQFDLDAALFEALIKRWRAHYLSKKQLWKDRALFRSLNAATQASLPPGGVDVTLYDLCRQVAIWVSAFEILTHPRKGKAGLDTVYPLLSSIKCLNREAGRKTLAAYAVGRKSSARKTLACWLYGKLYVARNTYLHGNPIRPAILKIGKEKPGLFWLAAPLYRLALTAFLKIEPVKKYPKTKPLNALIEIAHLKSRDMGLQSTIERALLRARRIKRRSAAA